MSVCDPHVNRKTILDPGHLRPEWPQTISIFIIFIGCTLGISAFLLPLKLNIFDMEEHSICLSEQLTERGYVFVRVMGGSKIFRRAGGVLTSNF